MWQRLRRSYPPQFELIPLFLLFLTVYQAWSQYAGLPARIPSHFNLQGVPDSWGGQSEVLVYPILGAVWYVILTIINFVLASARDPRRFINLPSKWKAALTDAQADELRVFLNRCLFVLKTLLEGVAAYGLYMAIQVAFGRGAGLGPFFNLLVAALLAVVAIMLWRTFAIVRPAIRK